MIRFGFLRGLLAATTLGLMVTMPPAMADDAPLLNVSYDVARDFYRDFNPAFIAYWKDRTGTTISIDQSHGGSSKQARAVIDGLDGDVLTTNNPLDIDAVAKAGLLGRNWAEKFPHQASPSWSTILFLVRKGNPKGIHDWNDLVKPGVSVIIPNPKTSGNGRYSYLAAWQYAASRPGGDEGKARSFVTALFGNVPVLDTGGRGATTTFIQRGIGDVLLTFENELFLLQKEFPGRYEVVVPSLSIRADNPVAVIDKIADHKGHAALARAYLDWHYSDTGQEIIARNGLRPVNEKILARHSDIFPHIQLFTVTQAFGGWQQAQTKHFSDGGLFDQIYIKH